jgi:Carboxypeptidase regulatory-like domain
MNAVTSKVATILAIFLLASGSANPQESPGNSVVRGHVFDPSGKAVKGARVSATPLETSVSGMVPMAVTNSSGEFNLVLPSLGLTRIYAAAEEQGYPDTSGSLYASPTNRLPEVKLSPGSSLDDVNVVITRGVKVHISIRNDTNKEIIRAARVRFQASDAPDEWASMTTTLDGTLNTVLPSRHLDISVSASGYQPWVMRNMYINPLDGDSSLAGVQNVEVLMHSMGSGEPE